MKPEGPRIVALSAEAADWLWRIGARENVVGTTAYFTQPADAPPKPRVSGFSSANLEQIEKLEPDLVITFSDVQAKLATELRRRGLSVLATDQRTLAETESTLALLARVVDREKAAAPWLQQFREQLAPRETRAARPRVYFEEWDEPFVSGIAWVSELIERAGGDDIFSGLRTKRAAGERIITTEQVREANPQIIFASWCGKPVNTAAITSRPGWEKMAACQAGQVYEIPGEDILQPGFRLTLGYRRIREAIESWRG